jgi:hypothetical protein
MALPYQMAPGVARAIDAGRQLTKPFALVDPDDLEVQHPGKPFPTALNAHEQQCNTVFVGAWELADCLPFPIGK